MTTTVRLEIDRMTDKRTFYNAYLGDELLASHYSPEPRACRALVERGITGPVEFTAPWTPYVGLRGDIERIAGRNIGEGSTGFTNQVYREHPTYQKIKEGA